MARKARGKKEREAPKQPLQSISDQARDILGEATKRVVVPGSTVLQDEEYELIPGINCPPLFSVEYDGPTPYAISSGVRIHVGFDKHGHSISALCTDERVIRRWRAQVGWLKRASG